jgi:hypothetical protein
MAGAVLGQLGMVAIGLVGLVNVVKARRAGRKSDPAADMRMIERMEMERRMASYLAARDDTKMR